MIEDAEYLSEQGTEYFKKGDYAKAMECFLELKVIYENTIGKEHPNYGGLLNNLGLLYAKYMKDYTCAKECYFEAKDIFGRVLGKEHPAYAALLNNIGMMYSNMGDYIREEEYFLESKNIWERLRDKKHPDYAKLLRNIGALYYSKEDYARAKECYLESKGIYEKVSSKEHPDYAALLLDLGALYLLIGDYVRAKDYYFEAKDIFERVLGKEHAAYANSLGSIGLTYFEMGDYARAKEYYFEAKDIFVRVLGKERADYANLLNGLGVVYRNLRDYALAEECYLESESIYEKVLNKEHPDYATLLNNIGLLYDDMGNYAYAKEFFLEAIDIRERVAGKKHPDYAASQDTLYCLYLTMREYAQALAVRKETNQQRTSMVNRFFAFLSEQEREKYWNAHSASSSFELSYSLSWFYSVRGSNILNYDNALFTKGLLLRTTNAVRDSIYASDDQGLIDQYEELQSLHRQIGNLQQRGDGDEAYTKKLEDDAEEREKYLVRESSAFRDFKDSLSIDWQDVRKSLRPGEAAVEFVSFHLYEGNWISGIQYAALVLRPRFDAPQWVPLFDCEQVVLEFLNEKDFDKKDRHALYTVIWQPLEPILKDAKAVYYSPSGLLHKISFNAIPTKDGVPLMDIYDLNLVSSTREVVTRKNKPTEKPASGVVYGGLVYDMDVDNMKREAEPYNTPDTETRKNTGLPDDAQRSGYCQFWDLLPGMREEGKAIKKTLSENNIPAHLYSDTEGNKESFINLGGKKKNVIHLATHGFFFGDIEKNTEEREWLKRIGGGKKVFENPLLRSGLILAGANNAWKGRPVEGVENGILFADDVAGMNLVGAQLVVLSACETGLGEVNNSEGVFGLQRAFKLAGAETLIMSLWKVDDPATCTLMTSFYEKWLSGESKQEAFKAAQQELRKKYPSPYYWAAFVMID